MRFPRLIEVFTQAPANRPHAEGESSSEQDRGRAMANQQEGDPQAIAENPFRLVVVAVSAGGIAALTEMLAALTGVFPGAVAVVQHRPPRAPSVLAHVLNRRSAMPVSDAKDGEFKVGQLIYVPFLQKYFINEDECTGSGPPVAGTGNCEADWEKKKEFHVDLWLGGNPPGNETDSLNCEDSLTSSGPVATIIVNPPSNEPVDSTPIFNSNTNACEKLTPF